MSKQLTESFKSVTGYVIVYWHVTKHNVMPRQYVFDPVTRYITDSINHCPTEPDNADNHYVLIISTIILPMYQTEKTSRTR